MLLTKYKSCENMTKILKIVNYLPNNMAIEPKTIPNPVIGTRSPYLQNTVSSTVGSEK